MSKKLLSLVLSFVLLFTLAIVSASASAESNLIRQTIYGSIEGQINEKNHSLEWLGVPYAKPPVENLRWRAPQDLEKWSDTKNTTKYAPRSIQMGGGKIIGSEDCLYLNVYRPNTSTVNLPVLFFLHGGNNQVGAGESFDGSLFSTETETVVVTVNTRLNALGFLSIDAIKTGNELEDSGNFGLLDINKALGWVRDNIKEFGGNPDNITVCGFSSGARNTLCMTISPLFKEKFHKAIFLCGGMTTMDPEISAQIATKALASLVIEDKIAVTDAEAIKWLNTATPEVKQYLMSIKADRFAKLMADANIRMSIFPHLFEDGIVIPKGGFNAIQTGNYSKVPMIFTSGLNEFKSKANDDMYFKDLDANINNPQKATEYTFTTKYGDLLFGYINAEQNAIAYSSISGQPPVYASRMLWGDNADIVGEKGKILVGGGHGMDFYLLQNQAPSAYTVSDEIFSPSNEQGRYDLGRMIRAYFANFMRTGNPNGSSLPEWKPWSNIENEPKILLFDADKTKATAIMTSKYTVETDVFQQILTDKTLSDDKRDFLVENILNERFFSKNLDQFWAKTKK